MRISYIKYLILSLFLSVLLPSFLAAAPYRDLEYFRTHTIIVRGDFQFAPFEFINDSGKPDGFGVDLFKTLMDRLGLKYDLKLEEWSRAQEQLQKDSVDVLIGMIYSEERAKLYKFSVPYFMATYDIVSRNNLEYTTIDQLKGKEIIVQYKDRAYEFLKSSGLTDHIIAVPDIATGLRMLSDGKWDALISYGMTSYYFINKFGLKNLRVHVSGMKPESYSIAVNSENEKLLYLFNAGLYQMKIDGVYDKIYNKWFGVYDSHRSKVIIWSSIGLIFFLLAVFSGIGALMNSRIKTATKKLKLKQEESDKLLEDLLLENAKRRKIEVELVKAKENAESNGSMKSVFLANMSHEIRTPLNVIVGFSELLESTDDPKEKAEYIQIIRQNSDMLLRLINDILDISKIEAGKVELKYSFFDFSQVFDDAYVSLRQRCNSPYVSFIKVNPYEHCSLSFDKNRLLQILTNFVTNAIKYTVKGNITMGYEVVNSGLRLYVVDTGIGLSAEKQKVLFGRFEKLDDFAQGTGLGLSIAKAIVDLVKGEIGVDSVEGKGSTFWAWIPCVIELGDSSKKSDSEPMLIGKAKSEVSKRQLLIAEDNDSNFLLLKALLQDYYITRATDGAQAVTFASEHKYDMILMDINMPNMNGLEATKRIRVSDQSTPIIAVTANAFDTDRENALQSGCNDFITKPINRGGLDNILQKYLI